MDRSIPSLDISGWSYELFSRVVAYTMLYPMDVMLGAIATGTIFLLVVAAIMLTTPRDKAKGPRKMGRKLRRKWVRATANEAIDETLARLWAEGVFTLDEVKTLHKQIARSTGIYDLFPHRLPSPSDPVQLKEDIIARRTAAGLPLKLPAKTPPAPPPTGTAPITSGRRKSVGDMRDWLLGKAQPKPSTV